MQDALLQLKTTLLNLRDRRKRIANFKEDVRLALFCEEQFFRQMSLCVRMDNMARRFVKDDVYRNATAMLDENGEPAFDPDLRKSLNRLVCQYPLNEFILNNTDIRDDIRKILLKAEAQRANYLTKWRKHFRKDPLEIYLKNRHAQFLYDLLRENPGDDYLGALLEYGNALESPEKLYAYRMQILLLKVLTDDKVDHEGRLEPLESDAGKLLPLNAPVFMNALKVPGRAAQLLSYLTANFNPKTHPSHWKNLDYEGLIRLLEKESGKVGL